MNAGFVLIKSKLTNEGLTTKSGVIVGFNVHTNYGEGFDSHVANLAVIIGEIVKIPKRLIYDEDNITDSMLWKTEIEVLPGDIVWFDYLASLNCDEFVTEENTYKILAYDSLWVAKRGNKIIPLNGYCLIKPRKKKVSETLYTPDDDKLDLTCGTVSYLGRPNDRYIDPSDSDKIDVEVGDKVVFSRRYQLHPIFLERSEYLAEFDEKFLLRVQRRDFALVIK
jgi:co-chaperonin GroES (HSP10)